jgi:hypothetical protein
MSEHLNGEKSPKLVALFSEGYVNCSHFQTNCPDSKDYADLRQSVNSTPAGGPKLVPLKKSWAQSVVFP